MPTRNNTAAEGRAWYALSRIGSRANRRAADRALRRTLGIGTGRSNSSGGSGSSGG